MNRFCKDCQYCGWLYLTDCWCFHPKAKLNPVTGRVNCEEERGDGRYCGPDGKLWEPRGEVGLSDGIRDAGNAKA